MRAFRLIPLLIPLALAVTGCNESPSAVRSEESGISGNIAFRLSATQTDSLAKVADSLRVVVDNGATKRWLRVPLGSDAELSSLPPGIWNVAVTLTKGSATVYQGSGFVTVVAGQTVPAKIILSPATGNLTVDIGIEPERKLPLELQRTWRLDSFPGMEATALRPTLQLLESGTSIGNGLWNTADRGAWTADDSLLWLDNDLTTKGLGACKLAAPSGIVQNAFCTLFGKPLRWAISDPAGRLTLTDPTTGRILAILRSSLEPIGPDPYPVVGVWGLLSMPIEGLEKANGSLLVFDSTGGISGTIGCNSVKGSWKLDDSGNLVIRDVSPTFVLCGDSVSDLEMRGWHLIAFGPSRWSLDTTASGMEEISLFSSFTGAKLATFTLARFGRSYPPTGSDIPAINVVKRPVELPIPFVQ